MPTKSGYHRVFVAGATGFIGRLVSQRLAERGNTVLALVRPATEAAFLDRLGVQILRGDIGDPDAVDRAIQGCDAALNLAVSRARNSQKFEQNRLVNVAGAENVARAAARHGLAHLLHVSSCGIYGLTYAGRPCAEDSPLRPDTNYRATKVAGENRVREQAALANLPVTITRLSTVYGPGSDKGWGNFARAILQRGRITGIGTCRQFHHLTYAADIVDALLFLLDRPPQQGLRIYNVGAYPIPTLRSVFDATAAALGVGYRFRSLPELPFRAFHAASTPLLRILGRESTVNQMIKFFTVPRAYDTTRLRAETGYCSKVTIEEGIRRTVCWLREQGRLEPEAAPFAGGDGGE